MKLIFAFLAIGGIINTQVWAGGCGSVCHKTYVQPYVSHVVTPVKKVVVVEQHKVEFDADYYLGSKGYYDVVNELRQKETLEDRGIIAKQQEQQDRLIGLLEQVVRGQEQILNRFGGSQTPTISPAGPQQPSHPLPPTNQPPVPQPQVPQEPVGGGPNDLDNRVFAIFQKHCATCHGANKADAGLQLVGKDADGEWLADLSLAERTLVHYRTAGVGLKEHGDKLMPLNGQPLSDQDVETLRQWMVDKARTESKESKSNK